MKQMVRRRVTTYPNRHVMHTVYRTRAPTRQVFLQYLLDCSCRFDSLRS